MTFYWSVIQNFMYDLVHLLHIKLLVFQWIILPVLIILKTYPYSCDLCYCYCRHHLYYFLTIFIYSDSLSLPWYLYYFLSTNIIFSIKQLNNEVNIYWNLTNARRTLSILKSPYPSCNTIILQCNYPIRVCHRSRPAESRRLGDLCTPNDSLRDDLSA